MATSTSRSLTFIGLVLTAAGALILGGTLFSPAPTPVPSATSISGIPTGVVASTTVAAPPGQSGRGQAVFLAKGCATCHPHASVQGRGLKVGPDLTGYRGDPLFLRRWLHDPAAVRPNTEMPNLNLHPDEIEALVSFLTTPVP